MKHLYHCHQLSSMRFVWQERPSGEPESAPESATHMQQELSNQVRDTTAELSATEIVATFNAHAVGNAQEQLNKMHFFGGFVQRQKTSPNLHPSQQRVDSYNRERDLFVAMFADGARLEDRNGNALAETPEQFVADHGGKKFIVLDAQTDEHGKATWMALDIAQE